MNDKTVILKMAFVLAFAVLGLAQRPFADVAGEWRVVRPPAVGPSSPLEDWLRELPGAVFALTHSVIPPLAMIRKDLGFTYFRLYPPSPF